MLLNTPATAAQTLRHTMTMWRRCHRRVVFLVTLSLELILVALAFIAFFGRHKRARTRQFDLFCHRFICRLPPLRRRRRRHRCLSPSCIDCAIMLYILMRSPHNGSINWWLMPMAQAFVVASLRRVRMLFVRSLRQICVVWPTTLITNQTTKKKNSKSSTE